MKKYVKILPLLAFFCAISVNAEVELKVNAEAAKLDGEKKQVIVEWDFKDNGVLQTKATDSVGRTKEMNIAIKYFIENGEIQKQITPGGEKYESCKVVEKKGSEMILKCRFLYYFLTKI